VGVWGTGVVKGMKGETRLGACGKVDGKESRS